MRKRIVIILAFIALPVLAFTTAFSEFKRWPPGDLHVAIDGLDGYEFSNGDVVETLKLIQELPIDLVFIYDNNIANGGVSFRFSDMSKDGPGSCFGTRGFNSFKTEYVLDPYEIVVPIQKQVITIKKECLELYTEGSNRDNAFMNVVRHEFLHGLGIDHIKYLPDSMPKPLMSTNLSTDREYFTWNDRRAILDKYGVRGKVLTFSDEDIGKTLYVIYKDKEKSFSVPITSTKMTVDWMQKNKKKLKLEIR